jgi:TIR domain
MGLTNYQRLYIQTVYDYFRENLQWPTYRQVQRKILHNHRDFRVMDVAKSIEGNPAANFHQNLDNQVSITLKEIHQLPESEQDLVDLIKVIRYSVEKYITEDKDGIRVTSEDIRQYFSFNDATAWKIFQLLELTTGIINGSGSSYEDKTWNVGISDSVLDYQDLASINEYFERREERKKAYQASRTQSFPLQRDQHTILGLIEPPPEGLKIFFCYAHEDETLLDQLKRHLTPLQRQGIIDVWYDRDISAGIEWEKEINKHLNTANIILLLISPDFISSEYCYSVEMKRALERHQWGEACVIPIILRHVHWQVKSLYMLQALPKDALPVISSAWHSSDEAFFNVVEGILKVFAEISGQSLPQEP